MTDKQNSKYSRIVEVAKKLFWKHGIRRISVEEICRKSSVSKMTFYKYFKNKEDLACTVMKLVTEAGVAEYKSIMESNAGYAEKLEKLVLMKVSGSKDVSYEVLQDIYGKNFPVLNKLVQEESQKNIKILIDDFKKAQEEGKIRNNLDFNFIIYLLSQSSQIIYNDEMNAMFDTPQKLVEAVVEMFIYGILPRNNKP